MDTIGAMIVIVKTLMAHGGNNMIKRKVTYKEPAEYFTPEMRKVAEEWDREHATEKEDKEKSANKMSDSGGVGNGHDV